MANNPSAFLVVRRDDGFGDVYPLTDGTRYTLGRAPTNNIVLKDDLCSREHAEVSLSDGRWHVRDLSSLNGTRLNGRRVEGDIELTPGDELDLGRTNLLFVEDMSQLPDVPLDPGDDEVSIKKRLGQTRFLTPVPPDASEQSGSSPSASSSHHSLSRDLSLL